MDGIWLLSPNMSKYLEWINLISLCLIADKLPTVQILKLSKIPGETGQDVKNSDSREYSREICSYRKTNHQRNSKRSLRPQFLSFTAKFFLLLCYGWTNHLYIPKNFTEEIHGRMLLFDACESYVSSLANSVGGPLISWFLSPLNISRCITCFSPA